MYSPAPRWAWVRYAIYASVVVALLLSMASRMVHPAPPLPPVQPWRPHPSMGRVIIPSVPREADARFDDALITLVDRRPDGNARGCWRLRGAGNDAGTEDRVECRLQAEHEHFFEVRYPGREPDQWRIMVPREEHEAVLVP